MSKTPITDEAEDRCRECGLAFVPAEDMRKLELRLSDVTRERDEYRHAFEVEKTANEEALAADRAVERALGRSEAYRALDGWKLVPIKPTEAMVDAGFHFDTDICQYEGIYQAMVAAAPDAP